MANKKLFASAVGALLPRTDAINEEQAPAYALPPRQMLAQYAATGCLNATFYASAEEQLDRVLRLCDEIEPEFIARTAVYTRREGHMKDMPALLCAVLSVRSPELLKRVFDQVIDNGRMLRTFVQIIRSGVGGAQVARHRSETAGDQLARDALRRADLPRLGRQRPVAGRHHQDGAPEAGYGLAGGALRLPCRAQAQRGGSAGRGPRLRGLQGGTHEHRARRRLPDADVAEAVNGALACDRPDSLVADDADEPEHVPAPRCLRVGAVDPWQRQLKNDNLLPLDLWMQKLTDETWPLDASQEDGTHQSNLACHGVEDGLEPAEINVSGRDAREAEAVCRIVADRLRDVASIAAAGAQPYQLLAAWAAVDQAMPKIVREALEEAMEVAIGNVPAIDGQVYVCPDVSGSMNSPVTGFIAGATTVVRCVDVAALIAVAVLRRNPRAKVIPFALEVVDLTLNARDSVMKNAVRLASVVGGGTNCSAPLALLNRRSAKGDLVVIVSDNQSWVDAGSGRGTELMRQWQAFKARNPQARLVCIDLQPYGTTQAVGARGHPERRRLLRPGVRDRRPVRRRDAWGRPLGRGDRSS